MDAESETDHFRKGHIRRTPPTRHIPAAQYKKTSLTKKKKKKSSKVVMRWKYQNTPGQKKKKKEQKQTPLGSFSMSLLRCINTNQCKVTGTVKLLFLIVRATTPCTHKFNVTLISVLLVCKTGISLATHGPKKPSELYQNETNTRARAEFLKHNYNFF